MKRQASSERWKERGRMRERTKQSKKDRERESEREKYTGTVKNRERKREREREKDSEPRPPFGPSVGSLCHPCITTIRLSYRFPERKRGGNPKLAAGVASVPG